MSNPDSLPTRAIVIDDDKDTLVVFSELLKIKNFEVLETGINGKEAVELFKKHSPQVVFLDYFMPEYDGAYALEQIRKIDPNAVVIVVTGNTEIENNQDFMKLNPNAIIQKPFSIDQLIDKVKEIIAVHSKLIQNETKK